MDEDKEIALNLTVAAIEALYSDDGAQTKALQSLKTETLQHGLGQKIAQLYKEILTELQKQTD